MNLHVVAKPEICKGLEQINTKRARCVPNNCDRGSGYHAPQNFVRLLIENDEIMCIFNGWNYGFLCTKIGLACMTKLLTQTGGGGHD